MTLRGKCSAQCIRIEAVNAIGLYIRTRNKTWKSHRRPTAGCLSTCIPALLMNKSDVCLLTRLASDFSTNSRRVPGWRQTLAGISQHHPRWLQSEINTAARPIHSVSSLDHITQPLRQLHWQRNGYLLVF